MRRLSAFLKNPFGDRLLLSVVLVSNIIGAIYGYTWYAGQLADTPLYLWPWVPDSPWSATLFALVIVFFFLGWRNTYLEVLAYAWVIKYGIWAVVVLTQAWYIGGIGSGEEIGLWISHLGMAVEGLVFGRLLLARMGHWIFITIWLFANDIMDYLARLHPTLYYEEKQWTSAMVTAVLLSLLISGVLWHRIKKLPEARRL